MLRFKGHFSAHLLSNPENILWEQKNTEVVIGGWLLAWVMASRSVGSLGGSSPVLFPDFPIWGLAIGTADPATLPQTESEMKLRRTLVNEVYRKFSTQLNFLNPAKFLQASPVVQSSESVTPFLEIQTIFNSNEDTVLGTSPVITEMGLVGGTTSQTDWLTDVGKSMGGGPCNTKGGGILLDYLKPTPFVIPLGESFVISTVLDFTH